MYGNETIECQHNGTWTNPPQCLQRCSLPDIANSNLTMNSTSFVNNSMINVTCTENAFLHYGNGSITCSNGTWTALPSCLIYKCYKPTVGSHANIVDETQYYINSSYVVTCDKGYDGNVTAVCKSNGNWNITGSCSVQTCPNPIEIYNSKDVYNTSISYSWNDTFAYRLVIKILKRVSVFVKQLHKYEFDCIE